jgi:hypothetical protein
MRFRDIQIHAMVAAVAAFGVSATCIAGAREVTRTVVVNTAERSASGQLAGARASGDSTQYIGCSVHSSDSSPSQDGGVFKMAFCYAKDLRGATAFCGTFDPAMIATLATVQGDSKVDFSWNANGDCTVITVAQTSLLEPKR